MNRLAHGFEALLEQVQELDERNAHLEHLLDRMQEQARESNSPTHLGREESAAQQEDRQKQTDLLTLHVQSNGADIHMRRVPSDLRSFISNGFKAWQELVRQSPNAYLHLGRRRNEGPKGLSGTRRPVVPVVDHIPPQCPFSAQKNDEAHKTKPGALTLQQEPLASPVHAFQNENAEDPIAAEAHSNDQQSHSPSQAGSASKCPIRFLDQHSAEELAEYFKNHSHELPRSHEICVKRYQRNEDQIRQLDHKYGSLVNMIQGLGHKHQSLLHTKAEDERSGYEQVSQEKIDGWDKDLENGQETQVDGAVEDDAADQRDGHFDRPLKEIRVGESPSRPWGIPVPQGASIPPSAASGQEVPRDISNEPEPPTPVTAAGQQAIGVPPKPSDTVAHSPGMVFTGPVFLGYSPDQIAEILQRTGLGKGGT
ncbi:MAG: hypothetical protein L6R37_005373 [Teloschistes peruensis]|nr:MAG: hypothetical protein L6R37_005373 [Teloschistes peruensis]